MKYGYFDESKKEYVITRPDTPAPWVNYLGSPEYGAIISNNAGGYSFAKSGANGRILRYVFNQFDEPGRYIYIRDNENRDYWSASWQPVGKSLDTYKSECHHGTAYTKMKAVYDGISSEVRYYVPLDQSYEVWNLGITNDSDRERELTVTGYAEFTNNSNYEQDQVNLQYSQFITRTVFCENRIRQMIHANLDKIENGKEIDHKTVINRFFGLAGAKADSWCGEKEEFLGRYHGYGNPKGVEDGVLNNRGNYNENGCGAISTVLHLKPGETREIAFLVGMKEDDEAAEIVAGYENTEEVCKKELEELTAYWHGKLSHFQVKTPSKEFDTMINTWNAYNCFMTFIWSRAASFTYCGLRNGYGYRDTVQDIQGVIHLAPEMAVDKIRFMLSAQVDAMGKREKRSEPVWVAEDSILLSQMIHTALTKAGYTNLRMFQNGAELWEALQACKDGGGPTGQVSIVITDLEMPQMDGHNLTKRIKEDKELQAIPVIIFSSLITEEMRRKGKEVGADEQLSKPEIGHLIGIVDHLLERSRRKREAGQA